jgi:hypothetical protein
MGVTNPLPRQRINAPMSSQIPTQARKLRMMKADGDHVADRVRNEVRAVRDAHAPQQAGRLWGARPHSSGWAGPEVMIATGVGRTFARGARSRGWLITRLRVRRV